MSNTLKILIIEDDIIETMKFNRTISTLNLNVSITEATNGEEALKILKSDSQLPNIILLDLNMPKVNGIEFLTFLKNNTELNHIPTIILTTSSNKKDLITCYKLGISGYILKPLKYEEYINKIKTLIEYWLINELKT